MRNAISDNVYNNHYIIYTVYSSLHFFPSQLLGYTCEEHDNPADFLLDVINHCEKHMKKQSNTKSKRVIKTVLFV